MNDNIKNKGWEQMQELLDKEMPVKKGWMLFPLWKMAAILIPLLLMGIAVVYQLYDHPFSKTSLHSKAERQVDAKYELINEEKIVDLTVGGLVNQVQSGFDKRNFSPIEYHSQSPQFAEETAASNYENSFFGESIPVMTESQHRTAGHSAFSEQIDQAAAEFDYMELESNLLAESALELEKGRSALNSIQEFSLMKQLAGLPFLNLQTSQDSLYYSSHFSQPFQSEERNPKDRKYRGIAINVGWDLPIQQKIDGLGIAAGPMFDMGRIKINPQLGIHHFGWFNQSGSYALFQSRFASDESLNLFSPPENTAAFEQPQKQALHSYSEISLELAFNYRLNPRWQLTAGIMGHRVFNIRYNANAITILDDFTSSNPDLSDPEERAHYLEYIGSETVNWINNYRLTTGLGIQYQLTSKYALRAAYRQKISPFWTADNNGAGSSLSAGLVIYAF